MTNCTSKTLQFSPLSRKKIEASFTGGSITSNAGVLLLREVDRKLELTDQLAQCLGDDRSAHKVVHSLRSILRQRIMALACGNEDLNDHEHLRMDACLQIACGRQATLASAPTLCRFEQNVTRKDCVNASKLLPEVFIQQQDSAPKELILDFDATEDKTHGNQEHNAFNGFYDHYCFLPLYVFCGDALLASYLRPSNVDGAKHAWAILALLVKRFRRAWPDVKIIFRGDSGFCRHKMFNWCERHGVQYICGIPQNNRLRLMIAKARKAAEAAFERTGIPTRSFVEFKYAAKTWTRKRRIIVRIEVKDRGTSTRFITTTLSGDAKPLYDDVYCARGDMENKIKQQKLDLGSGRTSCKKFIANQMRLLLSSMAYVLLNALKRMTLQHSKFKKAYAGTLINKFIKIGAVITSNTRRIKVMIDSHHPQQSLFASMALKLKPG